MRTRVSQVKEPCSGSRPKPQERPNPENTRRPCNYVSLGFSFCPFLPPHTVQIKYRPPHLQLFEACSIPPAP